MRKNRFRGLSLIRKQHQLKVLSILQRRDSTCPSLAKHLGLSKVALYRIAEELLTKDLIKVTDPVKTSIGRHPTKISLNENFGYFAAVDFSPRCFKIIIFDIVGKILAEHTAEAVDIITLSDIQKTTVILQDMWKSLGYPDESLKQICICTPGRIDQATGYFWMAARYENAESINLHQLFSEAFPCNVVVKNDMQLALVGYTSYIEQHRIKDLLFLYLGSGVGAALYLNGQAHNGATDTAGEFGSSLDFEGNSLSQRITLFGLCGQYTELKQLPTRISPAKFVELFKGHDPLAMELAAKAAKALAIAINNLITVIDIPVVLLSGDTCDLGDEFAAMVTENLRMPHFYNPPQCIFMNNGRKSMLDGCIKTAINSCFENILDELLEEKQLLPSNEEDEDEYDY